MQARTFGVRRLALVRLRVVARAIPRAIEVESTKQPVRFVAGFVWPRYEIDSADFSLGALGVLPGNLAALAMYPLSPAMDWLRISAAGSGWSRVEGKTWRIEGRAGSVFFLGAR